MREIEAYKRIPLHVREGHGSFITTTSGERLLDLYGGHATSLVGYGHPALRDALVQQFDELSFQSNATHVAVREAALHALTTYAAPGLTHAFFVNSGAEANENALRLALRATGRSKVVALQGAFHGRTAAAAAVTWNSGRWYGFPAPPFDVQFVPHDDPDALTHAIDDTVAAVIMEPVQGVAGARRISAAVLAAIEKARSAHGFVWISDEVQCGLGRSGSLSALSGFGHRPDVQTLGKGIAGGYPCAALLVSDALAAAITPGDLGTTFGGAPMACALVAAVAKLVVDEDLASRANTAFAFIQEHGVAGPVEKVHGAGLLVGLKCRRSASDVAAELRQRGLLVGTSADPHVARIMPPLNIEFSDLSRLVEALGELP